MNIAYFDCFAGAGGDMITAALLDAGLQAQPLRAQLETLGIEALKIETSRVRRCGIQASRFVPAAPDQKHHRHLKDITALIEKSGISRRAKQRAIAIFNRLAEAEAKVHGTEKAAVHFHEIGAVDSIVDIVSACVGLELLGIEQVYCSPLKVGGGTAKTAHGSLPAPAPATVELLKGVPIEGGPGAVELFTPTAAAILTTVAAGFGPLPAMKIESAGYGAGSIESQQYPNVLRVIIGESAAPDDAEADTVCVLQAASDDATGEVVGYVQDKLLAAGALDVFTTPIYMKHGRCGAEITVMCKPARAGEFERILFAQGLTFGIRHQIVQRTILARDFVQVQTEYGLVKIKRGMLGGEVVTTKAEFSDCALAAEQCGVPVRRVQEAAIRAFKAQTEASGA